MGRESVLFLQPGTYWLEAASSECNQGETLNKHADKTRLKMALSIGCLAFSLHT
jgi:hypothetical protein